MTSKASFPVNVLYCALVRCRELTSIVISTRFNSLGSLLTTTVTVSVSLRPCSSKTVKLKMYFPAITSVRISMGDSSDISATLPTARDLSSRVHFHLTIAQSSFDLDPFTITAFIGNSTSKLPPASALGF
ncbi:hypothetical protein GEV33_001801 [Tenebrio molitor]|uniref:Uncharacterized protein n=1 Tax=Tenebrio molitor TaxID=7067 RepID=A0A8J6HLL1_TENMO|nr:hypothetical protein GEV33_001801 [Tenebrio molitor]